MLFFGHSGITAGAAAVWQVTADKAGPVNRIKGLAGRIDFRMVVIGSLLPDLIDKPVFLLFGNTASLSGRDYAHSLLFSLLLLVGGITLLKYRKSWLLVLAFSSLAHLVLDSIWNNPVTLFWPLLGPLTAGDTATWARDVFMGITAPGVFIPEIIGLTILATFAARLIMRKKVAVFLRWGEFAW